MQPFSENSFIRITGGFVLSAIVLAGLAWLVTGPYKEYSLAFDSSLRYAIRQMQSPMWTTLFLVITKLGSTVYLFVVGSIAGIVFIALRWFRPLLILIVVMAGQAALHHGFKWVIARPRPSAMISYRVVTRSGSCVSTSSLPGRSPLARPKTRRSKL
jgi:hypothetical protein